MNKDELDIEVRINSDRTSDAGEHEVTLTGYLEREEYISNSTATIIVTLYWQQTDLTVEDNEYELKQTDFSISIPQLSFEPGLDKGDSDMISVQIQLKDGTSYEALPADLGSFNSDDYTLSIYTESANYIGYNILQVQYTMLDYMSQESMSTEFAISIFPKPVEGIGISQKPTFVLQTDPETNEEIRAVNVTVGADW